MNKLIEGIKLSNSIAVLISAIKVIIMLAVIMFSLLDCIILFCLITY